MYEELKQEDIVRKVGGRFKLSTLIQKRLVQLNQGCLLYTSPSPRDRTRSRMPSSA